MTRQEASFAQAETFLQSSNMMRGEIYCPMMKAEKDIPMTKTEIALQKKVKAQKNTIFTMPLEKSPKLKTEQMKKTFSMTQKETF